MRRAIDDHRAGLRHAAGRLVHGPRLGGTRGGSSSRRAAFSTTPTRTPTSFPTGSRSRARSTWSSRTRSTRTTSSSSSRTASSPAGDFHDYLVDSFERLYEEGGRMMSVGLHCRIVGRPGRAAGARSLSRPREGQGRRVGDDARRDRPPLARASPAKLSSVRIAIVGAGAMGSVYAGLLGDAGNEVWAIDPWEEHVAGDPRARAACRRGERRPDRAGRCDLGSGRGGRGRPGRDRDQGDARPRRGGERAGRCSGPRRSCSRFRTGSARPRSSRRCWRRAHRRRHRRRLRRVRGRAGPRAPPRHGARAARRAARGGEPARRADRRRRGAAPGSPCRRRTTSSGWCGRS